MKNAALWHEISHLKCRTFDLSSRLCSLILLLALLSGCAAPPATQENASEELAIAGLHSATAENTGDASAEKTTLSTTRALTATHTPLPTQTATAQPVATAGLSGPAEYPPGTSPLSGLAIEEPENLLLPPALVSVSNSPVTTRPQAGLSFSPMVFEIYLGEGDSRFLAVFHGTYPSLPAGSEIEDAYVGPIRSGRIPYEKLRQLFNGYLVFAGASDRVLSQLSDYVVVYNPDLYNINGGAITSRELEDNANQRLEDLGGSSINGLLFDPQPPDAGKPAQSLWVAFHYHDQIFWRYDEESRAYLRYQNQGEGTPFEVFYDRLNDEVLTFENVIILFADYTRYTETYFDIDLMYIKRNPALLFRDGKMQEIYWTTRNEDYERENSRLRPMRFTDYDFNPIALRPGQTWVEVVQLHSPYYETIDSENYHQLTTIFEPDSGYWAVHFYHEAYVGDPDEGNDE